MSPKQLGISRNDLDLKSRVSFPCILSTTTNWRAVAIPQSALLFDRQCFKLNLNNVFIVNVTCEE